MDAVKEWINDALSKNEDLRQMQEAVASAAGNALDSVRSGVATMQELSGEAEKEAQSYAAKAMEEYQHYEELAFDKMKEGIRYSLAHPVETTATLGVVTLLSLRGTRRALFRNTIGRLRSEEAMLENADKQVKEIKQSVELFKNETRKLEERARLAEEEMQRGKSKLKAAGGQIRGLLRSVYRTENEARYLIDGLKEMPGREPVRLRAEVANLAAEARRFRSALDKRITNISNIGVPV